MDQASNLPRSYSTRTSLTAGRAPRTIAPTSGIDAAFSTAEHSGSDTTAEPGEEPESPTGRLASAPQPPESDGSGDPLAEPIAALLGAALAVITLFVPILTVVTSPVESSSEPLHSPAATSALSRSRAIETGPAATQLP
jgi:hypothetical protein